MRKIGLTAIIGAGAFALVSSLGPALAADLPTKASASTAPASWWDTFTITGHVEAGVTANSRDPSNNINFGHLFTDKTSPLLNQTVLTLQRPLDPKATGYDFGFKFQAMYGSDARYTHFLGEFDESISGRNQFDIVEAHALWHLPWLTSGGIDLKVGQFVTMEGAEVIYAPDNALYSHSYIFNFGIPLKHTGIMATTHVNSVLDVMTGITTGVNTTFGNSFNCLDCGDNNKGLAFHGGIGLTLLNGALTVSATTHIGPENPNVSAVVLAGINPNSALRYLNDVTAIWKVTDKLTLTTDLNYIREDGFNATGYGVAQYFAYTINDVYKIVGRAEYWRDNQGFFVAAFPGNLDFVKFEHGDPTAVAIFSGGPAGLPVPVTYGALTLGLNITPSVPTGSWIKGLIFRPEIRYDTALNNATPFAAGTKGSQFTFGGDIIAKF
jgi:hypothetical protein